MTKNFNVWKLERKKNEEIKGWISSSSLILVYTIHLPTVHVCTKFQPSRPHSSWEKCDEKFSFQRLRNDWITEWQSDRMTEGQGKSSIAPTFSKRGYNDRMTEGPGKSSIAPTFSKRGYKNIFTNKSSSSGIYRYFNSSVRRVNNQFYLSLSSISSLTFPMSLNEYFQESQYWYNGRKFIKLLSNVDFKS